MKVQKYFRVFIHNSSNQKQVKLHWFPSFEYKYRTWLRKLHQFDCSEHIKSISSSFEPQTVHSIRMIVKLSWIIGTVLFAGLIPFGSTKESVRTISRLQTSIPSFYYSNRMLVVESCDALAKCRARMSCKT